MEAEPLRLDLGCGPRPRDGFEGVDALDFGQKHKLDLRQSWPWADESVAEAHSSHFIEHLEGHERVHFFNELYRVLAWGGTAQIIAPHWSSDRAYGDPTHKWPPVSNWTALYLHKGWRDANAPHTGYTCDFDYTVGFSEDPAIQPRAQDFKQFAVNHYRNAACDIFINLTKAVRPAT